MRIEGILIFVIFILLIIAFAYQNYKKDIIFENEKKKIIKEISEKPVLVQVIF